MTGTPLPIRPERLLGRLEAFARIGATPAGGVNRQALSQEDRAARATLADLAQARGFRVTQDGMANLFLRHEGHDPALPPVLIGSHLDSQPTGGRYDGALGVLSAFETLEAMADAGLALPRAVEVVAWTNEEGSRYAPGAMGSMAFAGRAEPSAWRERLDENGMRLGEELDQTLASLTIATRRPLGFPIAAYIELHIEQGPVLEREHVPIGIVTGIQGVRWLEVRLEGQAAHAGTTPPSFRRDPLAAAAAAIHRLGETLMPMEDDARFTVGRLQVTPGSINAIPQAVTFSVDLRHPDTGRLAKLDEAVRAEIAAAVAKKGCTARIESLLDMAPCRFPAAMIEVIEAAARRVGAPARRLLSGAYHDALFVSDVAPTAMIFVPSRDGLSHNEAEFTEPDDIVTGARVLYEATRALASA